MVWSAWGPRITVPPPHDNYGPFGHRIFDDIDPIPLRLYFASLLWRAAASKRREVAQITIPQDHIDRIAESLRSGVPLVDTFYPVTLAQYSTMGHVHQANPIARLKKTYNNDGNFTFEIPIFRFYFDGLIAHFHVSGGNEPLPDLGISGVSNYSKLCVHTIPFQESFQRLDLAKHVANSIVAWPEDSRKLNFDVLWARSEIGFYPSGTTVQCRVQFLDDLAAVAKECISMRIASPARASLSPAWIGRPARFEWSYWTRTGARSVH